jgi:hypothetical protein
MTQVIFTAENSITLSNPNTGASMTATLPAGAKPANFDLFTFAHDFVLDGTPMVFSRYNGHLLPALGAEVITSHGIGYVERITGDRTVIVRIVDFETTPHVLRSGEVSQEDYVARLADLYNNRLYLEATWLLQRYGDTKANQAKADSILSLEIDADCFEARVGDDCLGAVEFAYRRAEAPKLRERKKTRAELKAERKALEAEADAYLEDLEDAGFIADELAEFYGDE